MEPHPPVPRGVAHAPGRLPRAGGGYDARRAEDGFGYAGAIDGVFCPVTETAVGQFQTNAGLPATGVVDERTWMAPAGAAGATLESLSGLVLDRPGALRRSSTVENTARRFATFNRSRRTCAIRPSLAEPLSIGTRVWYHDTAQVAGEA